MKSSYLVHGLDKASLPLVFPLLRETMSGVTLENWVRYAEGYLSADLREGKDFGIVVAERDEIFRGLLTYRKVHRLPHGPTLAIRDISVVEVKWRCSDVVDALIGATKTLAHDHQCVSIQATLTPELRWAGPLLERHGLALTGLLYCLNEDEGRPTSCVLH